MRLALLLLAAPGWCWQSHHTITHYALAGEGLDPLVNRSFGTKESRTQSLRCRLDGIGRAWPLLTGETVCGNPG